ncbi:MAG: ribosome-associated translation inhibitor RaiA [Gammaproteobacteria bacterium]|nr:ribosome-associated translation inhibitor RaiA [Gammaproteobacteria bacterium]
MQLHFIGRNIELTEALKTFTQEKFQRIERRDHPISKVDFVFHVDKLTHAAEATIHLPGTELHAKAEANDMYAAIDELVDKISHLLIKHKEKHSNH